MHNASAFCGTLDARSINYLLLVGWAGGLSPELNPGEIVLGERSLAAGKTPMACAIPTGIQDKLEEAGIVKVRIGDILTSLQVLATPEAKQDAYQMSALAAEMEAYPLAAWANANGLPFVHARVILDAVHESLPELGDSLDEFGRPRIFPILARVVRHPALISQVWWLALRIRQLNSRLAALAGALVDALAAADAPI
jgi:nucleoside phosphorylase